MCYSCFQTVPLWRQTHNYQHIPRGHFCLIYFVFEIFVYQEINRKHTCTSNSPSLSAFAFPRGFFRNCFTHTPSAQVRTGHWWYLILRNFIKVCRHIPFFCWKSTSTTIPYPNNPYMRLCTPKLLGGEFSRLPWLLRFNAKFFVNVLHLLLRRVITLELLLTFYLGLYYYYYS
jgi:hypothetical protein